MQLSLWQDAAPHRFTEAERVAQRRAAHIAIGKNPWLTLYDKMVIRDAFSRRGAPAHPPSGGWAKQ